MASLAVELAQQHLKNKLAPGSLGINKSGLVNTPPPARPNLLTALPGGRQVPGTTSRVSAEGQSSRGGRTRRRFKKKRLMSHKYCKKTPCRHMGFTQKASCRPYKNCYTRRK